MKLMRSLRKKKKKLDNRGSSIIMVVVALAFIGIIVGALLSAAMYGYRQKIQDMNAKNNFYNVEQSMQEIYAGVGVNTITQMQEAYTYTLTHMVYFDALEGSYSSLDDESANFLFKNKFMENMSGSTYFSNEQELAKALKSYITDDLVELDESRLKIEKHYTLNEDGSNSTVLDGITIKNVTLTRTQAYHNPDGTMSDYTQTVSADIEIVKPEFNVNFTEIKNEYPSIFDYALVADMGVEIGKHKNNDHHSETAHYDENSILGIKGNIYAASDYYNKQYNSGLTLKVSDPGDPTYGISVEPILGDSKGKKVSLKSNPSLWYEFVHVASYDPLDSYDGEDKNSMFSGFYIEDANVSIMADQVIIPGSLSIMDCSDLTIYSGKTDRAEVWTDEIILGGSYNTVTNVGPQAYFNADLYVRDDTEINAFNAEFNLSGSYYGYGDNTTKDGRVFVSTVDPSNFTADGTSTATTLRDHYNSSAFIINGQNANINLANANILYIAGRAYIELSKIVTQDSHAPSGYAEDFYEYDPVNGSGDDTEFIRDYKTAESISVKYNQLMYDLSKLGAYTIETYGEKKYTVVSFTDMGDNAKAFLRKYFPTLIFHDKIPCFVQETDKNSVCYIDFEAAYEIIKASNDDSILEGIGISSVSAKTADDYAVKFVNGYNEAMTNEGTLKTELLAGLQDATFNGSNLASLKYGNNIYSSGAITTKNGSSVKFVTDVNNQGVADRLLSSKYATTANAGKQLAVFNDDLETQYLLRKWTLNSKTKPVDSETEMFVKGINGVYGEASITPINNYLLMNNLDDDEVIPAFETDGGYVFVSGKSISIDDKTIVKKADGTTGPIGKDFTGIIITKGDVTLGYGLESFKGTIIAGGKVYIDKSIKTISSGYAECKVILDYCLSHRDDDGCYKLLDLFKMYYDYMREYDANHDADVPSEEEVWGGNHYYDSVNIEAIDYSDVVSVNNWQKTVGGDTN